LPSLLYHYTGARGLQGILTSGKLWATNVEYLNDETEMRFSRSILREVFTELVDETPEGLGRMALRALGGMDDPWLSAQIFACCFCAQPDLLSMWRAYGSSGGYSIGFAAESL
jgi:hypothetical protein